MSNANLLRKYAKLLTESTNEALIGKGSDMAKYTHPDIEARAQEEKAKKEKMAKNSENYKTGNVRANWGDKAERGPKTEARGTEQERGLEKLQFGKDKPKPTKQEKDLEKLQFGKTKKKKVEEAAKVTDPTALKVKSIVVKMLGTPYSSARIAGGTVHRLSIPINYLLKKHYRYVPFKDVRPDDIQKMKDIKAKVMDAIKKNGIDPSLVDVKFHIGSGVYASIRTKLGADAEYGPPVDRAMAAKAKAKKAAPKLCPHCQRPMEESKQIAEYGSPKLVGSDNYDTSADFEDDVSTLAEALKTAKAILTSPAWNDWLQATDQNYSPPTDATELGSAILSHVEDADNILDRMYDMLSELG